MRAAGRIAAACVATLILTACDRPSPSTDRLASRYQGGKRTWVSESSLSKEPQKKPRMVIYEVTSYPEGSRPSPEQIRAQIGRFNYAQTTRGLVVEGRGKNGEGKKKN